MVKWAGTKMSCAGKRQRKKEHQFDEECMERKREMKETLRKVKEKYDEESRKAYERTEQNKRHIWQKKEAHHINASVTQKEENVGSHTEYYDKERTHYLCKTPQMDDTYIHSS
jgi:hypothetical protein